MAYYASSVLLHKLVCSLILIYNYLLSGLCFFCIPSKRSQTVYFCTVIFFEPCKDFSKSGFEPKACFRYTLKLLK